jgi:hypothetical protein
MDFLYLQQGLEIDHAVKYCIFIMHLLFCAVSLTKPISLYQNLETYQNLSVYIRSLSMTLALLAAPLWK